ncbi:hypothetical protein IL54_3113 [Sphingobium sp. ba1]|nr:hypothetical protein IL54_3113 [Sphingobium sp. ba1]
MARGAGAADDRGKVAVMAGPCADAWRVSRAHALDKWAGQPSGR